MPQVVGVPVSGAGLSLGLARGAGAAIAPCTFRRAAAPEQPSPRAAERPSSRAPERHTPMLPRHPGPQICRQPHRMALPVPVPGTPPGGGTARPSGLGVVWRGQRPLQRGCRGRSPPARARTAQVPPAAQANPPRGCRGQSPPAGARTAQVPPRRAGESPAGVQGAEPACRGHAPPRRRPAAQGTPLGGAGGRATLHPARRAGGHLSCQ
jgi:hypothetical protein